jgi:hypothetical protein
MLKKYFDSLGLKKDDQTKDKSDDKGESKDDEGFPAVHNCYKIYGRPSTRSPQDSARGSAGRFSRQGW